MLPITQTEPAPVPNQVAHIITTTGRQSCRRAYRLNPEIMNSRQLVWPRIQTAMLLYVSFGWLGSISSGQVGGCVLPVHVGAGEPKQLTNNPSKVEASRLGRWLMRKIASIDGWSNSKNGTIISSACGAGVHG